MKKVTISAVQFCRVTEFLNDLRNGIQEDLESGDQSAMMAMMGHDMLQRDFTDGLIEDSDGDDLFKGTFAVYLEDRAVSTLVDLLAHSSIHAKNADKEALLKPQVDAVTAELTAVFKAAVEVEQ